MFSKVINDVNKASAATVKSDVRMETNKVHNIPGGARHR